MNDDGWEAWEAAWPAEEQARLDAMRVRGYALALCKAVEHAKGNMEAATDRMLRARKDAEHAKETLERTLEQAELAVRVHMSGDAEWIAEVAGHLQECFG